MKSYILLGTKGRGASFLFSVFVLCRMYFFVFFFSHFVYFSEFEFNLAGFQAYGRLS